MPGIAGIISKNNREKNPIDVQTMLSSMSHETFYRTGIWFNDDLGVYAGWVCHEGSFCDCMPVWNEKKDKVLIYFGENFTDLELFDKLKARHHKFDNSNASYLIHMYEEKDIDFLQDLNGWFSGFLVDLQANKMVLFNDRYGMQKIFYHETKDAFYFASEAKALLTIYPALRELDMQGLAELLSCTCVLENRTLFKNIYLLPVASAWTFNQDLNTEKSLYFTPDIWEKQPWLEKNFFYERLQETFKKILLRYFRANQKIGISLTGGVDTRMIMAYADLPTGKYPCYTFGGMYRDCYDVKLAKKIAIECHQTHQTLPVDYNFLSNFSRYASSTIYITDGYLDVSGASEIYVNKLARDIAPIRMTGNFGGEVLRSIRHLNATPPMQNLFHHDFNQYTQRVKNTLDKYDKEPLSFILFNDSPWHNNNRLVSEQSQLTLRTPYMDNDLVALMYRMQCDIRNDKEMSLRLIRDGKPSLGKIVTDKGLCVDALFPLSIITHVFYEFLAKAEYAYDYGMPQWIARLDYLFRYMHFEKLFIGRHKFNHFRLWYRDDLADYVKSILLDERTLSRPYLNRKCLENVVQGHTKGHQNYTTEITQMLTVELIQRLLIEQR